MDKDLLLLLLTSPPPFFLYLLPPFLEHWAPTGRGDAHPLSFPSFPPPSPCTLSLQNTEHQQAGRRRWCGVGMLISASKTPATVRKASDVSVIR